MSQLNIKIIGTDLKIHHPGNTRNYGLSVAKGNWVVFIDADDRLQERALRVFNDDFDKQKSPCHLAGIQVYDENGPVSSPFHEYHMVWVHGKCYNRAFLNDHKIRFPKDLRSCEDYYFNYCVLAHLYKNGYDMVIIGEKVYDLMWNPKSITRSDEYYGNGLKSFDMHFDDHIRATLEPFLRDELKGGDLTKVFARFKEFLISDYFLYQYFKKIGNNKDTTLLKNILKKVYDIYNFTPMDIVNIVENDFNTYISSYKSAIGITAEPFVAPQSFRDWLLNL